MLGAESDRKKITITLKKTNAEILEKMADSENRNISRQVDFLIEFYRAQTEAFLYGEVKRAEEELKHPEIWLSEEALRKSLEG